MPEVRDLPTIEAALSRAHQHVALCYRFADRRKARPWTELERVQLTVELGKASHDLYDALHRVRLHRSASEAASIPVTPPNGQSGIQRPANESEGV